MRVLAMRFSSFSSARSIPAILLRNRFNYNSFLLRKMSHSNNIDSDSLKNTTWLKNPTSSNTEKHRTKLYHCEYNWIIENFKFYHDVNLFSQNFSPEDTNYEWFLQLFTSEKESDNFLNLYLESGKSAYEKFGSVAGELEVALIDSNGEKSHSRRKSFKTTHVCQSVYIDELVKQPDLINPANGLLPEGDLRIYCRVSFILLSETEYILRDDFKKYFKDKDGTDLRLDLRDFDGNKGETFFGHKSILAARSPVFAKMFESIPKSQLILKNINTFNHYRGDAFAEMLRYIYTGKVENLRTHAFELLLAADKFEIQRLKKMCEAEIADMLSKETAVEILLFSEKHKLKDLKKKSIRYIAVNLKKVMESDRWSDLLSHHSLMEDLLKDFYERCNGRLRGNY